MGHAMSAAISYMESAGPWEISYHVFTMLCTLPGLVVLAKFLLDIGLNGFIVHFDDVHIEKYVKLRMWLYIGEGGACNLMMFAWGHLLGHLWLILLVAVYCLVRTYLILRPRWRYYTCTRKEIIDKIPWVDNVLPIEPSKKKDGEIVHILQPTSEYTTVTDALHGCVLICATQVALYWFLLGKGTWELFDPEKPELGLDWHDPESTRDGMFNNLFVGTVACSVLRSVSPSFAYAPVSEASEWYFWRYYFLRDEFDVETGDRSIRFRMERPCQDCFRCTASLVVNEVFPQMAYLLFPWILAKTVSNVEFVQDLFSVFFISFIDNYPLSKRKRVELKRHPPPREELPAAAPPAATTREHRPAAYSRNSSMEPASDRGSIGGASAVTEQLAAQPPSNASPHADEACPQGEVVSLAPPEELQAQSHTPLPATTEQQSRRGSMPPPNAAQTRAIECQQQHTWPRASRPQHFVRFAAPPGRDVSLRSTTILMQQQEQQPVTSSAEEAVAAEMPAAVGNAAREAAESPEQTQPEGAAGPSCTSNILPCGSSPTANAEEQCLRIECNAQATWKEGLQQANELQQIQTAAAEYSIEVPRGESSVSSPTAAESEGKWNYVWFNNGASGASPHRLLT